MNLAESVSDWHDSEGNTGSVLDKDDKAMAETEQTILDSFQAFAKKKVGSPGPVKHISKALPVNKAVKAMHEMVGQHFRKAVQDKRNSLQINQSSDAVTKLNEVKDFVRNSFKGKDNTVSQN